ncbi:UPF0686 protein C11orf1 homolog [Haliotis rufescens]|uniref:UPF0686 protein C11orf1 homolog n=1 Tax=Haliotis rufescens TaxID=6454 RepID=UPI001EB07877|nr:UPF0686 protein C11orf1 homolog [Haliotis rufescens]
MERAEINPPFRSMVRASGLGEIWTHSTDQVKFNQFGWRCTTKENSFANGTLIGNWNEDKFDIRKERQAKSLPSQYNHFFESTYDSSYNPQPHEVPRDLKHLKARHPYAFPGHQPELDRPALKATYNSWETTTRASYVHPSIRAQPLTGPETPTAQTQT